MNLSQPAFYPFLLAVLLLFYFGPARSRLYLLLGASYAYAWFFGWRAPAYLLFVTFVSYFGGVAIARHAGQERKQRNALALCIALILAALAYSKYLTFALDNALALFGNSDAESTGVWQIIAPIGLSYYSFQAIGYLLDIHWEKSEPEGNFSRFALFLAFFPKLVTGPIERADGLLPALRELPDHRFQYDQAKRGLLLIAWGLFLKIVIADHLGEIVNAGYAKRSTLVAGIFPAYSLLFYVQLYYDFCGYTRIARGVALLFGLPLRKNFDHPFLATTVQDFWRRWHLSLSTWINDYLYFPLRMHYRKSGTRGLFFTLLFTFFILGLWHGAAWPYIFFGVYHGGAMCVSTWSLPKRDRFWKARGQLGRSWLVYSRRAATFVLVWIGMGIFRCDSAVQVAQLAKGMFFSLTLRAGDLGGLLSPTLILALAFSAGAEAVHLLERRGWLEQIVFRGSPLLRWSLYVSLSLAILFFGKFQDQPGTIYAQF